MSTLTIPKISAILDKRKHIIDENINDAIKFKTETEVLIARYKNIQSESRIKAIEILKKNDYELTKQIEDRQKQLSERLNNQIKSAECSINDTKQHALINIHEIATDISKIAIMKLTGVLYDDTKIAQVVTTSIEDN
jgi:F0F1-type ATP synthase membrane subunit b/b'